MTLLTLNIIKHSLGHTSSGKLILSFGGVPRQFHAAHIKWSSKDHFEAAEVLLKRISKKVEGEDPNELINLSRKHVAFGYIKKRKR
jgi:hypothetical protein